jgi:hypothetical protein
MIDEAELLQTLRLRWEYPGEDEDLAHGIYRDDAVLEFPQSGERFEGVQNFREWRRQFPAKLEFHLHRINRRGDLVVAEYVISHNGAPWLFTVSIMEVEDDRVSRERIYITEGWEPAEWRAPWRAEQPTDPAPPWLSEPPRPQKSWYKHPLGIAGITLAILILVSLISSVFEPEQTSSNTQQRPDASAEKSEEWGVMGKYAARVEKEVGSNFAGGRITSRCNMTDRTWHCFFYRYESPKPGRIDVFMAFPATLSAAEASRFAEDARLHTFNMAGPTIESLDTVVSYNNEVYSGTTYREDVPPLNNKRIR